MNVLVYDAIMKTDTFKVKVIRHLVRCMKKNDFLWFAYNRFFSFHNRQMLKKHGVSLPLPSRLPDEPTIENLTSQIATTHQCFEPKYKKWCAVMRSPARMNRKQWEHVYALEALRRHGCLSEGKRGLGFGCGQEPLSAIFASYGCEIVATDLDFESAYDQGWATTQQHAATLDALNQFELCPDEAFKKRVSFRVENMNAISDDLQEFDFLWSSCAFEHLGSIEHGLQFVHNAMKCLKPGGIAVHTTEFNLSSDDDTINEPLLCLYRKQDMLRLAQELRRNGHEVAPFNFFKGALPIDDYVDLPPWKSSPSLKIQIQNYAATSIGLIIRCGKN